MEIKKPASNNPIPAHAKRVFKGQIFDVYQWEQRGYDGKIHIFEKLRRSDTALVIPVTEDEKIVIAKQEQPGVTPFIGLVGGRFDEGEGALDAAKRELLEETGYESADWELFDASQPVSKIDWAVYLFIARGCKKVADQHLDGAEKVDTMLVNFDKFVEIMLSKDCRDKWLQTRLLQAKLDPTKMEAIKKQLGLS